MSARRVRPELIKVNRTYDVRELATRLGVHKNTVRGWQKAGMEPIDDRRPTLFLGTTIREFLKQRSEKRKKPCPPGALFCLACREPRRPALGMVEFIETGASSVNLCALCESCGTTMYRRARRARLSSVMPGIDVQIVQGHSRLNEIPSSSLNHDSDEVGAK